MMGNVKANNFEKAFKQLTAIDESVAKKLPMEIFARNAGAFNVVLVRKVNDIARERYLTTFAIQCFNPQSFEKLNKRFQTLGYHSIHLLHDPTKVSTDPIKTKVVVDPIENEKPFDVDKSKVAELREFAEENSIRIADDDLKKDIVKKIKAWQKAEKLEPIESN